MVFYIITCVFIGCWGSTQSQYGHIISVCVHTDHDMARLITRLSKVLEQRTREFLYVVTRTRWTAIRQTDIYTQNFIRHKMAAM